MDLNYKEIFLNELINIDGGLCDKKYFETAEGNIYSINLDEYISIDKNYYNKCIDTFKNILNNIQ